MKRHHTIVPSIGHCSFSECQLEDSPDRRLSMSGLELIGLCLAFWPVGEKFVKLYKDFKKHCKQYDIRATELNELISSMHMFSLHLETMRNPIEDFEHIPGFNVAVIRSEPLRKCFIQTQKRAKTLRDSLSFFLRKQQQNPLRGPDWFRKYSISRRLAKAKSEISLFKWRLSLSLCTLHLLKDNLLIQLLSANLRQMLYGPAPDESILAFFRKRM